MVEITKKPACKRAPSGHAYVEIEIDGEPVQVFLENQKLLYHGHGLVFLGADWEERVPVQTVPPDPDDGRPQEWEVRGYTDDPDVVAAVWELVEWAGADWWPERPEGQ